MALKRGFSLIELLVVVSLLTLLSLLIASLMLTSIVNTTRIRTNTRIKQAGNYAINELQSFVRNSKSILNCDSTANTLTLLNFDGGQTTYSLAADRIASNSSYLTPTNLTVLSYSISCSPDDTAPQLVQFSFDLKDTLSSRSIDYSPLHFETSISLRNE
ncbi:MAG: prepilin-type N-terminal cleavage/methylation domain-containing protein [bacterium]